jgi:1,2-dihydroxy-3-keto-5-methylthiopentene dioxygenase
MEVSSMSMLTIWADGDPSTPLLRTTDTGVIGQELAAVGIAYSHHDVRPGTTSDSTQEEVLSVYRDLVDDLCAQHGYTLVDVVQLHLDENSTEELRATAAGARQRFLNEHTHDEEEIRFFSHGSGVFYLHIGDRVLGMLCTEGDLLSVPSLTTHWFDMGTLPDFTAIRFFRTDDGWVGTFTGSDIASGFPTFDELSWDAIHA